jgi:hypothetical protein
MKSRPVAVISLLALAPFVCGAVESWQKDPGPFVKMVAKLASKATGDKGASLGDRFAHKEVKWTLSFKGIQEEKKGEEPQLDFDLEPLGILHNFFSGERVMMTFKPAAGTIEQWKSVKPGSKVNTTGVIESVTYLTMNNVPAALVQVENVRVAGQ